MIMLLFVMTNGNKCFFFVIMPNLNKNHDNEVVRKSKELPVRQKITH